MTRSTEVPARTRGVRGRLFLIALAVAPILALAGCGPSEGDVLAKRWKPDLSYWGPLCSSTGSGRVTCSPHWYYNPPQYILVLRTPDGKVKDKHVGKTLYYSINVGDHFKEA